METIDYNKYESYIRVGHTGTKNQDGTYSCSDLADFPTPTSITRTLHDVDVDAYTDLRGYTHRNRVRHDVEEIEMTWDFTSDDDQYFILNKISPAWIYIELIDKKTGTRKVHKVYASDKSFGVFRAWYDSEGWHELSSDLAVTFVEE